MGATGGAPSVTEFVEKAFGELQLDWHQYVETDERYLRPAEVDVLQGDAAKAEKILKWTPTVTFDELVKIMVESDLELAKKEKMFLDTSQ